MSAAMPTESADADAEEILMATAAAYRAELGERLLAAYALGSLAHGGFSPLVSDIDLGLVLVDPHRPDDRTLIEVVARAQKASGKLLSERLSVFWGTPGTLRGDRDGGRFPALDRLDLLENGRLLIGTDVRRDLPRPSPAELVTAGAEFALEFLAGVSRSHGGALSGLGSMGAAPANAAEEVRRPEVLIAAGVRRLTKLVLFPVRFMFTAENARVGTNEASVQWYAAREEAPSKRLVEAGLAWRTAAPKDHKEVADLLREDMVPLYMHYIDDHILRLEAMESNDLARAFMEWRARLGA